MVAPGILAALKSPEVIGGLISAGGAIGGGFFGSRGAKETKTQKIQRQLIDQLMGSLQGQGPYSDLFQSDESAFQRSIADPLMNQFKNRTAPGIQQQFISSGLQRGTGLDDALARAGVDVQSLINQQYLPFQQGVENRRSNAINSILGAGAGAAPQLSSGQAAGQATAGYFNSPGFETTLNNIIGKFGQQPQQQPPIVPGAITRPRPGYEQAYGGG